MFVLIALGVCQAAHPQEPGYQESKRAISYGPAKKQSGHRILFLVHLVLISRAPCRMRVYLFNLSGRRGNGIALAKRITPGFLVVKQSICC
jgi:hypothetical protein